MSGEIPDEDLPTLLKWYEANDFDDLLRLNRAFLRGESEFTLYHAGPIFVETTPMVPGLLRLHDYGMLTWQSQPWEIRDPFKCGCCMDRGWVQVEQISFISFLLPQSDDRIPKETLKAFLVELVTDEDIYVSIIKFENRFMYTCDGLDLRITSSFPKKWATHLDKCAPEKEQIDEAEPKGRQAIDLECTCALNAFQPAAKVLKAVRPLLIHVLEVNAGDQDLPGIVEKAAIRAGLEKVYAE